MAQLRGESPGNSSGSDVCAGQQVLLSNDFHSRPGSRQKSVVRKSMAGGGGQKKFNDPPIIMGIVSHSALQLL